MLKILEEIEMYKLHVNMLRYMICIDLITCKLKNQVFLISFESARCFTESKLQDLLMISIVKVKVNQGLK